MNLTLQHIQAADSNIRGILSRRITGANRDAKVDEAQRQLSEQRARVQALGSLIAAMEASSFVSIHAGNVDEYRQQLAVETANLARLQNVVSVFDQVFEKGGEA